ncbi:hypothetical protein PG994_009331 [Apiospora phragmitis]|uniref:Uncharacterized protein n=1 Tax=Apiospora phragmitis TaxID=2905665 RepID=A0ABR1UJ01_9PEZI
MAEDTRIFYLPAENTATAPVVCVSLNVIFDHNTKSDLSRDEVNALVDGEHKWATWPNTTLC